MAKTAASPLGSGPLASGSGPGPSADPISEAHAAARARFDKVSDVRGHLQALRDQLDKLTRMGDMVEPDDVVKAGASLIGHGFGAHEIAAIMSEMPQQGGQVLQEWIATHEATVREMEAQAEPVMNQARHHLAVAALNVLVRDHMFRQPLGLGGGQPLQTGLAISNPSLTASSPTVGQA